MINQAEHLAADPTGNPTYILPFTDPPLVAIITPEAQLYPINPKDTMVINQDLFRKQLMQTIVENTKAQVDSVVTARDVYGGLVITVVIDDVDPQITEVIEKALVGYGLTPTRWKTNPGKESWLRLMIWADQPE
jgi:hypothetical protein